MVSELPEELLEQAKLLLTLPPNQANLRRAVSTAYYAVFHLLVRATALKWNEPLHQARIARMFEHERMKRVSGLTIKSRPETDSGDSDSIDCHQAYRASKGSSVLHHIAASSTRRRL